MISGVSFALLTVCVAYHLNVCIQCCIRASCMHWYTERFGTAFAHCPVRLCVPYSVGKEWALSSAFYFPYSVFFYIATSAWSTYVDHCRIFFLQHLGHLDSFRVCPSFLLATSLARRLMMVVDKIFLFVHLHQILFRFSTFNK